MRSVMPIVVVAVCMIAACSNEASPQTEAVTERAQAQAQVDAASDAKAEAEASVPEAGLRREACALLADDVLRRAGVEVPEQVRRLSRAVPDQRQAYCSVQWFKPDAEQIAEHNAAIGAPLEQAEPVQVVGSIRLYRDFDSIEQAQGEYLKLKRGVPGEAEAVEGMGTEGVWSPLARSLILRDEGKLMVVGFYASVDPGRDRQAALTIATAALGSLRQR